MRLESWGLHPHVDSEILLPGDSSQAAACVVSGPPLVAYGLGRSYGDSALAPRALKTERLNFLLSFDEASGVVDCLAGVSLDELLRVFVPKGWFLPVTPGTKYVSVGGAIASDVHGKNHHVAGCFSSGVLDFDLLLADGSVVRCSREERPELFQATCGGMGLTGVVLRAKVRLQKIKSALIDQVTYKARCLEEALDLFEKTRSVTYSVAWIDCLSRGASLGRSLLMVGEHAQEGPLKPHTKPFLDVPFMPPVSPVHPWTMKAFNTAYYHQALRKEKRNRVHYEPFFYPLDMVLHWNRLYGKGGFTQYQFVLPLAVGARGLRRILERIAASGKGSFLAVLKVFGEANANPLSFPFGGYTLALDFKIESGLFDLLEELDREVLELGGRLYLTKDVRMSEATFKRSYPRWREFQELREKIGAKGRFASLQSRRLGLDV